MATLGHEDIGGFDIPVDHACGMGSVQCIGDVNGESEKSFHFQRTPRNTLLQRHTVQKFHHNEWLTLLLPDFVDGANVGMVQRRSCLCLTLEPSQRLWVFRYFIRQELQSNETMEGGVLGLIHHTHSPAAEFLKDAVVRNDLGEHGERHSNLERKS